MSTDAQKYKEIADFYEMLRTADDLTDNLEQLANFLKKFTGATGVYIGKLVPPKRDIAEDDDDRAHLDEEQPKVIHF